MQRGDGAQKRKNERNPKDRRKEGEMNVHNGRLKELKTERQKERRHERKTDTRDLTNVSELFLFLALANERFQFAYQHPLAIAMYSCLPLAFVGLAVKLEHPGANACARVCGVVKVKSTSPRPRY